MSVRPTESVSAVPQPGYGRAVSVMAMLVPAVVVVQCSAVLVLVQPALVQAASSVLVLVLVLVGARGPS